LSFRVINPNFVKKITELFSTPYKESSMNPTKKTFPIVLFSLIIGTLMMTSCKKDTPEPERKNEFSVAGQSYAVTKGYLIYWGVNSDSLSYDWDVLVVSDGVFYSVDSIGGTGQAFYMDFNSSGSTEFTPGTYTFANQRAAGTFVDASALIAYDFGVDDGIEYYLNTDVPGGPILVKKSGSIYEIEGSFNAERDGTTQNQAVVAYYKGQLSILDFSIMRTEQKKDIRDRLRSIKN